MNYSDHSSLFHAQLDSWIPSLDGYATYFTPSELELLRSRAYWHSPKDRTIVHCAWSNSACTSKQHCIHAVSQSLRNRNERVLCILPMDLQDDTKDSYEIQFTDSVKDCAGTEHQYTCFRSSEPNSYIYYISVENRTFFGYKSVGDTDFLSSVCIFNMLIPKVLRRIGIERSVIIHAHDCYTALALLSAQNAVCLHELASVKTVFTLYSLQDIDVPPEMLKQFFGQSIQRQGGFKIGVALSNSPLLCIPEHEEAKYAFHKKLCEVMQTIEASEKNTLFKKRIILLPTPKNKMSELGCGSMKRNIRRDTNNPNLIPDTSGLNTGSPASYREISEKIIEIYDALVLLTV